MTVSEPLADLRALDLRGLNQSREEQGAEPIPDDAELDRRLAGVDQQLVDAATDP
jgi:hypothetical protein